MACSRYLTPPCKSLEDLADVSLEKSFLSIIRVERLLLIAARAVDVPVAPAPIIAIS